jgi:hypothetical protein
VAQPLPIGKEGRAGRTPIGDVGMSWIADVGFWPWWKWGGCGSGKKGRKWRQPSHACEQSIGCSFYTLGSSYSLHKMPSDLTR